MDITYKIDDTLLNYRVAAIIRFNNKILIEEKRDAKHLTLPGGRVKLNETSIEALTREIKEETGYDTKYIKSKGVVENFYVSRYTKGKCQEILFIHELEFRDKEAYLKDIIVNQEEKKKAVFRWIDIDELKNKDFKPNCLMKVIEGEDFEYIIDRD